MYKLLRGEIYLANLQNNIGSIQNGLRPVVIIQNDTGNLHSTTTLVIPVTSKLTKHEIPTHFNIDCLHKPSIGLCEQIQTINKNQLVKFIGELNIKEKQDLDESLKISLSLK